MKLLPSICHPVLALALACTLPSAAHAAAIYDTIIAQDAFGTIFASVTATPTQLANPYTIIYLPGVAVDQDELSNYSIVVDGNGNAMELFGIAMGGPDGNDLGLALEGIAQSYSIQNAVTDTGAPIDMTMYLDPALQALGDTASLIVAGTNPAVPEPLTWAMMVVGFATIGGVVRRTRTRTTRKYS